MPRATWSREIPIADGSANLADRTRGLNRSRGGCCEGPGRTAKSIIPASAKVPSVPKRSKTDRGPETPDGLYRKTLVRSAAFLRERRSIVAGSVTRITACVRDVQRPEEDCRSFCRRGEDWAALRQVGLRLEIEIATAKKNLIYCDRFAKVGASQGLESPNGPATNRI